jgi:hypothetical protein
LFGSNREFRRGCSLLVSAVRHAPTVKCLLRWARHLAMLPPGV